MTTKINEVASELTENFVKQLHDQIAKQVQADVNHRLAQFDIRQLVREAVDASLAGLITKVNFPASSIPGTSIDLQQFAITGDNIVGGVIKKFGSTGIQDSASQCQVTILDKATVVENTLISKDLEVKGNVTIDGDLILTGEIPTDSPFYRDLVEHSAGLLKLSMDGQFFLQYADKVFEQIKSNGIDLARLTLDGNEILKGNKLGYFITDTNIQKVGELRELRVTGDLSAANTLFVNNKRLGINTEEPAGALAVWDEECELVARKLRKDVSIFGSMRNQRVVLSSNSNNNLVLETDGSVSIEKLTVGAVQLRSAPSCPRDAAERGTVVFNEQPELGQPVGWVSLGNARWSSFGTIV